MTPALRAMVEAMIAELHRQARDGPNMPYVCDLDAEARQIAAEEGRDYDWGPQGVIVDGTIDLEAVARAGLEAIREPDVTIFAGIDAADLAADPFEGTDDEGVPADPADGADHWRFAIDAILKEQP